SLGRNARFLKPAAVLMAKRIEQVEVNHFCRNGVSRYSFLGLCWLALNMLNNRFVPSGSCNELFRVAEVF
ncbi:MAG: hypothetical protein PHO81_04930, partial [Candidatus Omnitrophica bacterium]|nr:hypothetical protein [Candidatus Omnitrophota bacterium]